MCEDSSKLAYLCRVAYHMSKNPSKMFDSPAAVFRQKFEHYLNLLCLSHYKFKSYSLRRGGATFDFWAYRNFERTMLRGRWQSVSVARIYVNEALAEATNLKVPEDTNQILSQWAN